MFVRRYCSMPVMSPARRSVLSRAQRPTWLSYPSAATTHFASIVISSSRRFARIPRTEPSSLTTAVAVVLSQMSAPAFAASFATALSKASRSRTIPTSLPAWASSIVSSVPFGEKIFAPLTSRPTHLWSNGNFVSSTKCRASPSPQRTGEPISCRFSIRRVRQPPIAAYRAVIEPDGPAPTTTTSYWYEVICSQTFHRHALYQTNPRRKSSPASFSLHRVELVAARIVDRADRADLHAHAALGAVLVERQVDLVQEDRVRRACANAGSAVHAEHVVDRHDAVVADRGTDRDNLLRHAGPATPRSAPRTSSRFPRGSWVPCCMRRTG